MNHLEEAIINEVADFVIQKLIKAGYQNIRSIPKEKHLDTNYYTIDKLPSGHIAIRIYQNLHEFHLGIAFPDIRLYERQTWLSMWGDPTRFNWSDPGLFVKLDKAIAFVAACAGTIDSP